MYPRNAASPEPVAIGAVVQISDGAVQTSGCTVRIKPIGVAEGDGAGTTSYSTDGIVYYTPTQAETNYTSFILIAKKTGCVPVSVTVVTSASATAGYAGVDWSKVTAPTTTLNLSGTTVKTATDVEADTQDIQSRLPAALVGGRIDANMGAISTDATAADNAEAYFDGTGYAGTNNVIPTVTTLTNAPPDSSGVTTLLSRIPAALFSGITSLAQWLGLLGGKQTGNATARTELRATGAGSGTYDETTDSLEAVRDNTGTAGAGLTAIDLPDQTMNITGNLSGSVGSVSGAVGSVTGSVGSVTGNVGGSVASVAAGGITAASFAADAITAAKVATDVGAEIATAVRTELGTELGRIDVAVSTRLATAGYTTPPTTGAIAAAVRDVSNASPAVGSLGENILDTKTRVELGVPNAAPADVGGVPTVAMGGTDLVQNVVVSSASRAAIVDATWDEPTSGHATAGTTGKALTDASAGGGLTQADVRTAIGMAAANLDTQLDALPTAVENADALLGRNHEGGANGGRTVRQCFAASRNKVVRSGGTLTVYAADDVTPLWTATITTDAGAEPITAMDPA